MKNGIAKMSLGMLAACGVAIGWTVPGKSHAGGTKKNGSGIGRPGRHFMMASLALLLFFAGTDTIWGYWANTFTYGQVTFKLGVSEADWNGHEGSPPNCYLRGVSGSANALANLTIPGVITWNNRADGDYMIPEPSVPVPLTCILSAAFRNFSAIYEVTLSDKITAVNVPAFRGCKNLRALHTLYENDPSYGLPYAASNGVLYKVVELNPNDPRNSKYVLGALVKYPEGKNGNYFDVPAEVTELWSGCLAGTKLKAVRFPGKAPNWGSGVFEDSSFVVYCPESWGLEWGELWNGRPAYPIPEDGIRVEYGITNHYEVVDGILWEGVEDGIWNGKGYDWGLNIKRFIPTNWSGAVTIPASLGGMQVTFIGYEAFEGCTRLTSVTIPDGVTRIGSSAFEGCSGLKNLSIPDGVTEIGGEAFKGCSGLKNLSIPDTVTEIGYQAFKGCSGLTSLTIPDSVTTIGYGLCDGCSGLATLSVPGAWMWGVPGGYYGVSDLCLPEGCDVVYRFESETVDGVTWFYSVADGEATVLKASLAEGMMTVPATLGGIPVTSLGENAFENSNRLVSVVIPGTVTSIGSGAFSGCSGLSSIEIPNSVTGIGDYVFFGCSGLINVTIPSSVTNIGFAAFSGCSGLTEVAIPNSVASIGSSAFSGCSGLTNFVVAAGNENYRSENGVLFNKAGTQLICCPPRKAEYAFPDGVTDICASAFYGCSALTSLTIPNSVTNIGVAAFSGCSGLTSLTIPNSVTNIEHSAFFGCSGLTSLTIPEGTREIRWTFWDCSGLTTVTLPASVATISYAFEGCNSLTNIVVAASNARYRSENGVLFDKTGTELWSFPPGKTEYAIPDGVTVIVESAFSGCSRLASLTIPSSVTTIQDSAFTDCSGLTTLELPDSVTRLGWAFEGCTGLATLLVPGSWEGTGMLEHAGVPDGCEALYRGKTKQVTTFKGNGGTPATQKTTNTICVAYGTLPTPSRSGHAFLGWFTAAEGGSEVKMTDKATAETTRTLWAHWTDRQVTTFNGNGGKPAALATTNTIYADYGTLPEAKWSGHAFLGWFNQPEGGKRVFMNSTVTLAATRTLYAQWTDQQVTTFKANGGYPATQKTTNTIYEAYGAFPAVKYSGHALVGWFNAPEGGKRIYTNSTATLAATRTLYAQWTTNQVTTFKGNGGTPEIQKTTNAIYTHYGTLPEAVWENHVFLGWFNHPTKGKRVYTNTTVTLAATRSLYAHWTDKQVVTFKGNGGSPTTAKTTNTMGKAYGPLPTPKKSGHALLGWFTAADGGGEVTAEDLVTVATTRTLYAHWTDQQVTTFKGNGGTPSTQKTTNTIYAKYGTFPSVEWKGHAFQGWYTASEGGKRVYTNSTVTLAAERTLWARWTTSKGFVITGFAAGPDGEPVGVAPRAARGAAEAPNVYRLRFELLAGVEYEIQWTPSMTGEWETVDRFTAETAGEVEMEIEAPDGETGFFRVVTGTTDPVPPTDPL